MGHTGAEVITIAIDRTSAGSLGQNAPTGVVFSSAAVWRATRLSANSTQPSTNTCFLFPPPLMRRLYAAGSALGGASQKNTHTPTAVANELRAVPAPSGARYTRPSSPYFSSSCAIFTGFMYGGMRDRYT